MSNPFASNNRFSTLSEASNNPFGNKKEKRESNLTKDQPKGENRFLKRDNNYRRYREPVVTLKEPEKVKEFILEENLESFPTTIEVKNTNTKNIGPNFKDVLNQVVIIEKPVITNTVKPGHIKLMDTNGNPVFERGPLTDWEKEQIEKEEYQKTPYYIMNTAINKMQTFWDLDERLYDYLNGEGAYKEKYCLPPVYDSDEYDSDSEDYDCNDYDSDELYNNEY